MENYGDKNSRSIGNRETCGVEGSRNNDDVNNSKLLARERFREISHDVQFADPPLTVAQLAVKHNVMRSCINSRICKVQRNGLSTLGVDFQYALPPAETDAIEYDMHFADPPLSLDQLAVTHNITRGHALIRYNILKDRGFRAAGVDCNWHGIDFTEIDKDILFANPPRPSRALATKHGIGNGLISRRRKFLSFRGITCTGVVPQKSAEMKSSVSSDLTMNAEGEEERQDLVSETVAAGSASGRATVCSAGSSADEGVVCDDELVVMKIPGNPCHCDIKFCLQFNISS